MVLAAASNFGFIGLSPDCSNREMMEAAGGSRFLSGALRAALPRRRFPGGEMVEYCSESCQSSRCNFECETKRARTKSLYALMGREVSLLSAVGSSETHQQSKEILFPYEESIEFFNWDKPFCPPCGLINGGNSCYANVVLQSLTYTRPLAAYLLEKGHKIECRIGWINGPFCVTFKLMWKGFAIDKMQSVFLSEFGGEKIICSKCSHVSSQFDRMMDLAVEIHEDAESLEKCLDRFTAEKWLQRDNMHKFAVLMSWHGSALLFSRHPTFLQLPRKDFSDAGSLRSYMTELEDRNDVYKLYAVIVRLDMLDSFSHYICYVKDFGGNWYRIDDDKVSIVGLDEVLSLEAYMLLYSRICARPSCVLPVALLKERENKKVKIRAVDLSMTQPVNSADMPLANYSEAEADGWVELSLVKSAKDAGEDEEMAPRDSCLPTVTTGSSDSRGFYNSPKEEDFPLKLDFFEASSGSGAAKNCTFEKD